MSRRSRRRPETGTSCVDANWHANSNGWPGERWLDVRHIDVLGPIIEARLDLCRAKGFDSADADNMDGYTNTTGFPLTADDQLAFNVFAANAANFNALKKQLALGSWRSPCR